jgi:hypothetical protein
MPVKIKVIRHVLTCAWYVILAFIMATENQEGIRMGIREAYQKKANTQLREWQAWFDEYDAGLGQDDQRNAADHLRMVARVQDCIQRARSGLSELCAASDERWELSKQAVERALIDLKKALDESGIARSARLVPVQVGRAHVYEPFERKGS